MFEVTGRFYEEGASVATVSTDMAIGGDRGNRIGQYYYLGGPNGYVNGKEQ